VHENRGCVATKVLKWYGLSLKSGATLYHSSNNSTFLESLIYFLTLIIILPQTCNTTI